MIGAAGDHELVVDQRRKPKLGPRGSHRVEAALRKAFVDAANDREFLAEIQSKGGSIELMSGEELQAFVGKLHKTSPQVIKAAKQVLGQE